MGLATVHADCVENVINRIITLIKKDIRAQYYSEGFLEKFLARSIDYIIFLKEFNVNTITKINYDEIKKTVCYRKIKN